MHSHPPVRHAVRVGGRDVLWRDVGCSLPRAAAAAEYAVGVVDDEAVHSVVRPYVLLLRRQRPLDDLGALSVFAPASPLVQLVELYAVSSFFRILSILDRN